MKGGTRLDPSRIRNSSCLKCDRENRDKNLNDGKCDKVVSATDSGAVRCVGPWADDKIHFLTRYFNIFGNGMHRKWEGNLHYVEMCSGPGRCINRETAEEFNGTALAVMSETAYRHFKTLTFLDKSPGVVAALQQRISSMSQQDKATAVEADYTEPLTYLPTCLQRASLGLTLVFLDPTDCSVPMDTVRLLSTALRSVDFIINVATGSDANRNFRVAFRKEGGSARKKYERFLGSSDFYTDPTNVRLAEANKTDELRTRFRTAYQQSMQRFGYRYFGIETVRHYYDLLFASKHPTGLKFWDEAKSVRPDGQLTLGV